VDLIKIADALKGASDQQLAMEMQQPSGHVPPYLVLTELTRRQKMRESFQQASAQAPQDTTVAQDVIAQQPQQVAPPMQQQPMQPQGYAGGGLVTPPPLMNGAGGIIGLMDEPPMPEMLPPASVAPVDMAQMVAQAKQIYGEPDYAPVSKRIAELDEQLQRSKKRAPWEALMQAGLAMAASRNPTLLGAAGEGGIAGLQQYAATKGDQRQQAAALLAAQGDLMGMQNRDKSGVLNAALALGGQAHGRAVTDAQLQGQWNQAKNNQEMRRWEHAIDQPDREVRRELAQAQIEHQRASIEALKNGRSLEEQLVVGYMANGMSRAEAVQKAMATMQAAEIARAEAIARAQAKAQAAYREPREPNVMNDILRGVYNGDQKAIQALETINNSRGGDVRMAAVKSSFINRRIAEMRSGDHRNMNKTDAELAALADQQWNELIARGQEFQRTSQGGHAGAGTRWVYENGQLKPAAQGIAALK
jgi:hypothetical protein